MMALSVGSVGEAELSEMMAESIPARPGGESKRGVILRHMRARWEQSQTNPTDPKGDEEGTWEQVCSSTPPYAADAVGFSKSSTAWAQSDEAEGFQPFY